MTTVEQIADAILYEGYILYPYRASALKNGQRWNFGVLYPPAYAAAQRGSDASTMQCECLARGDNLSVTVRFLQLLTRDGWQEAITREVKTDGPGARCFVFPGREDREQVEGVIDLSVHPVHDGWS